MRSSRPLAVVCLCLLALSCAAAPAVAAPDLRVQAAPELPGGASFAGAVAPERDLDLYVALEPRDPAALASFAEEVATPGSPTYGDYLSVPQFAARFGPTPAQVATVRAALSARGLDVGAPSANSLSIPVTATAAEAEAAFGTAIDRVETATGRLAFANRSAPRVAAAAAPYVQAILGLDDLTRSHRAAQPPASSPLGPSTAAPDALPPATTSVVTGGPQPCTEAIDKGAKDHGYTIDEFAAAYGLDGFYAAGNFGAGQTVALLEMEPFFPEDINAYQACYGTHAEVEAETVGDAPITEEEEDGEAAMDIENVIGLAPEARVLVYQSKNDGGAEARILSAWVTQNQAKVMSSSWGICEPFTETNDVKAVGTLLQEAAAQGQSFFVAAGDWGSTDCFEKLEGEKEGSEEDKELAVDYPGSDPFATDVGGTRLENPTSAPTDYLWNEAPAWGAGGSGRSEFFPMPAYQRDAAPSLGVVSDLSSGEPCGLATGSYCRQIPDVAADAAVESGWVVHASHHWEVNGGTSAAAPFWAAVATLTNASPACAGTSIGFANPALYAVAGSSAYASDFRDVTGPLAGHDPTTSRLDPAGGPFPAGPGYDMASGLGSPIAASLGSSLCAIVHPPAPPVTQAAPVAPKAAPPMPAPAAVGAAHLANVLKGKPRLTFSLAAREGAKLTNLSVQVPPALDVAADPEVLAKGIVVRTAGGAKLKFEATSTPGTIRIKLRSPQPAVRLKIAFPALETTPKLTAHIREGRTKKLGLVVTTRETGNAGARLALTVRV